MHTRAAHFPPARVTLSVGSRTRTGVGGPVTQASLPAGRSHGWSCSLPRQEVADRCRLPTAEGRPDEAQGPPDIAGEGGDAPGLGRLGDSQGEDDASDPRSVLSPLSLPLTRGVGCQARTVTQAVLRRGSWTV